MEGRRRVDARGRGRKRKTKGRPKTERSKKGEITEERRGGTEVGGRMKPFHKTPKSETKELAKRERERGDTYK